MQIKKSFTGSAIFVRMFPGLFRTLLFIYFKVVYDMASVIKNICAIIKGLTVGESFYLTGLLTALAFNIDAQTSSVINTPFEIKGERGMYSKVYLKENGNNEAVISSLPVHYKKNNMWEEISTNIIPNKSGYQNENNVIRSYFPNNINDKSRITLIVNENDEIIIHAEKKQVLFNNSYELSVITGNSFEAIANVADNRIKYSNIYTNISDEFTVLNGKIKNDVILSTLPTLLNEVSSGYFGFRETLELPVGWKITTADNASNILTSSPLIITDAKGSLVLTIPEPVFFDSYGSQSDGANPVKGKYLIEHENDLWNITTMVPVQWLKDANTKYPVSIDPTVVLAGIDGGWQSPNNWVDNAGFVFIGVCCANLTHRGWILFNTSSIPTNSCITNVELQVNVGTVVANTPEVVFINDVTGTFGPYLAINPAAYTDFGNGFYNSFTINGTGTYGYYSLGASANTLLQTQLPLGKFEVALQFSNEPSTDYKIINGTSSNLRVTYSACTLPIELLSFDAKCEDGKVNLNWTTALQKNNDQFIIERTANGADYEFVGAIAGAGNSNEVLSYSFVDTKPLAGTTYYALKQNGSNGAREQPKLVAVGCSSTTDVTISPNPSAGTFVIKGATQDDDILITDILGQIIFQSKITGAEMEIDLGNNLSGIYFMQLALKSGVTSKKIVLNK